MTTGYQSTSLTPLEIKSGEGEGKGTGFGAEDIAREIKALGTDVAGVRESLTKDLAEVRKLAEEAKSRTPDVSEQIAKGVESISQKMVALEELQKKDKDRLEALETMTRRTPAGGGSDGADLTKAALEFFTTKAARKGNLEAGVPLEIKDVDIEAYEAWSGSFGMALRKENADRFLDTKALSAGSNPDGGYLVPTDRSSRIIEKVWESSPLRQLATIETIGGEKLEIPVDVDEAGYQWVGEETAPSNTATPQQGLQTIAVHELAAMPKTTTRLLEDADFDVEAWLERKVAERFGRAEATAFISGSGSNKPRGILTYAHGTAGARQTIEQVNSGAAAAITGDAIVGMPLELKSAYTANAVWLMKRSSIKAVMLLKDGQGQYLWRPGLEKGAGSILAGYTVNPADDMPAIQAGPLSVAFGDFRRGYTVVDRRGITVLRDPFVSKPFVLFYTRKRVGGDVTDFEAFKILKIAA